MGVTLTREQFKQRYGQEGLDLFVKPQPQDHSHSFLKDLRTIGEKRGEQFFKASDPGQSIVSQGLQATGAVLGGAADVIRAGAGAAFRTLTPKALEQPLRDVGEKAVESVLKIPGVDGKNLGESIQVLSGDLERLRKEKPELGKNIDAILSVGDFALSTIGLGQGLKTVDTGIKKTLQATKAFRTGFDDVIDGIGAGIQTVKPKLGEAKSVATGFKEQFLEKGRQAGGEAKSVATGFKEQFLEKGRQAGGAIKRTEVNTAEKQALRQAFEELDDVSKGAVQQGLLPRDVNLINSATPDEKTLFNKLKETASTFAEGRSSTPPSQLLGDEWLKRLTALDSQVGVKGQKLGEFVKDIPARQLPDTMSNVMAEMNKVQGLQGLTVNSKDILDFTNTILSSSVSKAERKVIQNIFNDIKGRGGKRLHQLRQELFADLGGKKKGGLKLTDTEDNVVNAMRKGMSNTLDNVSDGYKALNQEFAQLAGLKKEIKRVFGEVSEGNEDLFALKSSKLLRRLTSNATSGQDFAELIRETEKALSGFGIKFGTDITKVQDFMNMLNRYYDISGDTSLLGILRTADIPLSKKGAVDKIINSVFENASVTDETAKNAIKELLEARP